MGLEDAVDFQDAQFDVIETYYSNEGFNDTVNDVIQDFYDRRKELKTQKNPAEQAFKLFMNSMYGIKFINPIDTYNKVIPYFEWDDYVSKY